MSFKSLQLSQGLLEALTENGITKPTPIQTEVIPSILKKADVLGIAKTGSGKTASYVLPLLQNMQEGAVAKNRHIRALIVVPTRELAEQVKEVFLQLGAHLPNQIKTMAVYGGVSINPQMMKLQGTQVLVATPGRLLDLVESNAVHLSEVETLVLDEADKMLMKGFKEEMTRIFKLLPAKRQNLLFSATLSSDVDSIHQILLKNPVVAKVVEEEENPVKQIEQTAYFIDETQKGPLLRYLIKNKNLEKVLVFASSMYKADNVAEKLRRNGISARAIHGNKSQGQRNQALENFKLGKFQVLVTTDLLTRGIDIDELLCVINYELPRSPKDYVHRIGRTGRADKKGIAISFVIPDDEHHFKIIQKKMKHWVDRVSMDDIDLQGY